ncbi:MAG: isoleucine--tRNA ligase [Thermodesulfobacteriota bacterium]
MSEKKKNDYRGSLNLPEAKGFPMKAGLLQKEPVMQKEWEEMNLFSAIREKSAGRDRFVLHDGPPYANGSIHIGHLLNKILKDLVVRSKTMRGFDSFLIPGWDCHGLPIEHKVLKETGGAGEVSDPVLIRKKCRNYADKFVRVQTKEMKRLGTVADYENPYLTMHPQYEAGVLEVFAALVAKNIVRHDLKPVHWSIENKTALAEAELEYHDRTDPSVYALFPVTDTETLPASLNAPKGVPVSLMIWTTTPWTLPANLAIAVAPEAGYGLYKLRAEGRDDIFCVVAEELAESVFSKNPEVSFEKTGSCAGKDFVSAGTKYSHPFIEYEGTVVCAPYVGTDEGTGLVHTAPGHGAEDYITGIREGLDTYCPVLEDGSFDSSTPGWLSGKHVWEGNKIITEKLRETGLLFHTEDIVHSYPHDWRGKTPTIFRATAQWFIKTDEPVGGGGKTLRRMALDSVNGEVAFHPEWGRKRFAGMLESRPDWCISRQRSWGLPIPAFTNADGDILMTEKSILAVAEKIRERGSGMWFEAEAGEMLSQYDPREDKDAPEWAKEKWDPAGLKKGNDIFDVWFESGSSWHSVIEKGEQGRADLYLEGSDQHRGWFQSSLLPSLGATGAAPFSQILTHGFIVDSDGRKMSKSGGNALEVAQILKQYGADVCRWWVSSLNYSNDVKADIKIIESAADEYRTIRNTVRFLLSNLNDFNPETDGVGLGEGDKLSIDGIARVMLKDTVNKTLKYYSGFDYKEASRSILFFCDSFLSRHYIGTVRDRLYCDGKNESGRRKTQTVINEIADALIKLCAPILVHTAEEAYRCLPGGGKAASVHLTDFPCAEELTGEEAAVLKTWTETVIPLKDSCLLALEEAKKRNSPSNPLDAEIECSADTGGFEETEIADLLGVSRFRKSGNTEPAVKDLSDKPKCERCWKREPSAAERADGGILCDRCLVPSGTE